MKDGEILQALNAGDVAEAAARFDRLAAVTQSLGARALDGAAAWDALKQLLERRGYFAATPEQISRSLQEIREVGEGFDLYELLAAAARYDRELSGCRGTGPLALLKPFAPACSCGPHESPENKERP